MDPREVQAKVPDEYLFSKALNEFVLKIKFSRTELAMKYVLSENSLCSTIIGNDSLKQLEENLSILEEGTLDPENIAGLQNIFRNVPDTVTNPALWTKPANC